LQTRVISKGRLNIELEGKRVLLWIHGYPKMTEQIQLLNKRYQATMRREGNRLA
jgi:hypothetical protein